MSISWTDIRDLPSGEFATIGQSAIQAALDEASREASASVFGARYDDAVKYLAAHLLACLRGGSRGMVSGAVVSETVGPISRSFGGSSVMAPSVDSLGSTSYGRRFQDIRRQVAGGPVGAWV